METKMETTSLGFKVRGVACSGSVWVRLEGELTDGQDASEICKRYTL